MFASNRVGSTAGHGDTSAEGSRAFWASCFAITPWYPIRVIRTALMLDIVEYLLCDDSEDEDLVARIRSSLITAFTTIGIIGGLYVSFTYSAFTTLSNLDQDDHYATGLGVTSLLAFSSSMLCTIVSSALISVISFLPDENLIATIKPVQIGLALPLVSLEAAYLFLFLALFFYGEVNMHDNAVVVNFVRVTVALALAVPVAAILVVAAIRKERLREALQIKKKKPAGAANVRVGISGSAVHGAALAN